MRISVYPNPKYEFQFTAARMRISVYPNWVFQFTTMRKRISVYPDEKDNFSLPNFSLPRWTRISVYLVLSLPGELHRISIYLDNFSLPGMFSVYRSSCNFSLLQWKCEFQFIPRKNLTWFQFNLKLLFGLNDVNWNSPKQELSLGKLKFSLDWGKLKFSLDWGKLKSLWTGVNQSRSWIFSFCR